MFSRDIHKISLIVAFKKRQHVHSLSPKSITNRQIVIRVSLTSMPLCFYEKFMEHPNLKRSLKKPSNDNSLSPKSISNRQIVIRNYFVQLEKACSTLLSPIFFAHLYALVFSRDIY